MRSSRDLEELHSKLQHATYMPEDFSFIPGPGQEVGLTVSGGFAYLHQAQSAVMDAPDLSPETLGLHLSPATKATQIETAGTLVGWTAWTMNLSVS